MCAKNPNLFDFVITLGGDGTVLFTSWLFQRVVPPVLCFGFGSLGFMTEYDFKDREEILYSILEKGVSCSLRMRFECTVMRATGSCQGKDYTSLTKELEEAGKTGVFAHHKLGESYCILNDVVVDRGPNPTITTTELYGDFKLLTAIQADGVVISTPSGSTAYSLSAGGSLVHPDIPGVLVSPICPHTLSFRPLVLPDSLMVRIGVPYDARVSAWCSFDGKSRVELRRGDFLNVSASRYPFPKVHDGNSHTSWFGRLSETLHWNERKRQKSFNYDTLTLKE
jgi:NAD+ kinase